MAIRFTDKTGKIPPTPEKRERTGDDAAREVGEARFASPIEAVAPVNPDPASELPFGALPKAEAGKKKRPGRR